MDISQIRIPKRTEKQMIPGKIGQEHGLVEVDTTWGSIQPIQPAESILTIGEQEVFHHKKKDLPIIDTRKPATMDEVSIPGLKSIP